jgi:hypothetical protein
LLFPKIQSGQSPLKRFRRQENFHQFISTSLITRYAEWDRYTDKSFDVMSDGHADRRISSSRHLQSLQIAFLCITPGVFILTDCLGSSYHERRNNDQDSLGDIHARNQYRYGGTSWHFIFSKSFVLLGDRYRESRVYSSCRRNHGPVSFRPFGARSSHWYIPQSTSRPRA